MSRSAGPKTHTYMLPVTYKHNTSIILSEVLPTYNSARNRSVDEMVRDTAGDPDKKNLFEQAALRDRIAQAQKDGGALGL